MVSETKIKSIAIEIFKMFKNRTDGENKDIDDINPKSTYHFHFKDWNASPMFSRETSLSLKWK